MNAFDVLMRIASNDNLALSDFRYCLVDAEKHPLKIDGTFARPNHDEDFSTLIEMLALDEESLKKQRCIGISVHASNVCAIDIDHCVKNAFDVNSIDSQANDIITIFKDFCYIEFSFSGHGIRMLLKANPIEKYSELFYTKNSKLGIEFYYPEGSARYVTLTGFSIFNNPVKKLATLQQSVLFDFLSKFMKRESSCFSKAINIHDDRTVEELMKKVKLLYLTNNAFQDLWFSKAPGSGHDESERDFHIAAFLYENVTQDREKVKALFEQSYFFKSKDWKHINKWQKQDCRYFNYIFDRIQKKHS